MEESIPDSIANFLQNCILWQSAESDALEDTTGGYRVKTGAALSFPGMAHLNWFCVHMSV